MPAERTPEPPTAPAPRRAAAPAEPAPASAVTVEPIAAWERVCVKLREQPSLASLADDLQLTELGAGVAIVSAPTTTKANYARTRQTTLAEIFSEVVGDRVRVEVRMAQSGAAARDSSRAPASVAHADAVKDPLVRRAMELFDARIVDVRDDAPGGAPAPGSDGDAVHED